MLTRVDPPISSQGGAPLFHSLDKGSTSAPPYKPSKIVQLDRKPQNHKLNIKRMFDYINNCRVFRTAESHANSKYYGKSLQQTFDHIILDNFAINHGPLYTPILGHPGDAEIPPFSSHPHIGMLSLGVSTLNKIFDVITKFKQSDCRPIEKWLTFFYRQNCNTATLQGPGALFKGGVRCTHRKKRLATCCMQPGGMLL